MKKYDNLYCKMFIDINCNKEELIDKIAEITNGEKKLFRTIETSFSEIDVNENDDYYSKENDGSFLYYKFFLDIEPNLLAGDGEYISHLSNMIQYFLAQKIKVIPSCDFEDELPTKI